VGVPSDDQVSRELWARVLELSGKIHQAYDAVELRDATQALVQLGFEANKYLQDRAPWSKRKQGDVEGAHGDLSLCANVAWAIGTWLAPILPRSTERLVQMLGGRAFDPALLAAGADYPLEPGTVLGELSHLATPIDDAKLATLWPEPGDEPAGVAAPAAKPAPAAPKKAAEPKPAPAPVEGIIGFDDFMKVELRVGHVLAAERVPKADKLLKLTIDVGEGEPRTIAAGIAEHYEPEALPGKNVVVVANLAPRTIRGIESRGMLLAGGGDTGKVVLAEVPGVAPGSRVKRCHSWWSASRTSGRRCGRRPRPSWWSSAAPTRRRGSVSGCAFSPCSTTSRPRCAGRR
jgi:methionyl-tRNA synthetase